MIVCIPMVYVERMVIHPSTDSKAPRIPAFTSPCGNEYPTAAQLMSHVQVCEFCMIAQQR